MTQQTPSPRSPERLRISGYSVSEAMDDEVTITVEFQYFVEDTEDPSTVTHDAASAVHVMLAEARLRAETERLVATQQDKPLPVFPGGAM